MDELEFDVFCAHNSHDKNQVEMIADKLKRRNIKSWIDKNQILGGQSFQTKIQEVIPKVKSAAIFFGESGLGNWQKEEIEFLLDECKHSNKSLIPVLLPGVKEIPRELGFIRQRNFVSFGEGSQQALDKLEASIKCKKIEPFFDIILCYREEDTLEIREIEKQLKMADINLWKAGISSSNLHGSVLRELDRHLSRIWSMAVFVGNNGGPWGKEVIEDIILEFREEHRIVIPVILNSAAQVSDVKLPVYLRRLGAVDFRQTEPDPRKQLIWGITGCKPTDSETNVEENGEPSQSIYPFSVFLSHASADKETVFKVVEAFKKAKISYWVDHEQIRFGDPIVDKIEEGLQKSKYVVVCLSEKLVNSGWCRAEYGAILDREFSEDTSRRVITLSLDGSNNSSDIPLLLSEKLRADFTDPNNFSEFIQFMQKFPQ
jgi:TIR domain